MRRVAALALLLLAGCAQPAADPGFLVVERLDNPNVEAVQLTRDELDAFPLVGSLLLRWDQDRTLGVMTLEADPETAGAEIRGLRAKEPDEEWPVGHVRVRFEGVPFDIRVQSSQA